jgi:hypothetical protein
MEHQPMDRVNCLEEKKQIHSKSPHVNGKKKSIKGLTIATRQIQYAVREGC